MFSTKIRWYKIAENRSELFKLLGDKDMVPFSFAGKSALLVWHDETFFLVKNKCPHQGIKLTNGYCEKGHIVCPYHHYGFDLKTGRGAGLHLENYPIEEKEDGIFAGLEYFSLF